MGKIIIKNENILVKHIKLPSLNIIMEYISKIGSKGEIFIPKKVRDELGLHANQPISIIVRKNGIFICRIRNEEEILKRNEKDNVKISYHVIKSLDSEIEENW